MYSSDFINIFTKKLRYILHLQYTDPQIWDKLQSEQHTGHLLVPSLLLFDYLCVYWPTQ